MLELDALERILGSEKPEIKEVLYGDTPTKALIGPGHKITPLVEHQKETSEFMSLDSFIEFVAESEGGQHIVVQDNKEVHFLGDFHPFTKKRQVIAKAQIGPVGEGELRDLNQEQLLIALRSRFAPTADRDYLIEIAAKVVAEHGVENQDDGVSQRVVVKKSVAFKADTVIKPVLVLQPYRTFYEIKQPDVEMMIRINQRDDRPFSFALMDCDGGRWRHDCMKEIAAYLRKSIKTYPVWL